MKHNTPKVSLLEVKYNEVVDAWSKCTDKVAGEMMKEFLLKKLEGLKINSVFMMADSGAKDLLRK